MIRTTKKKNGRPEGFCKIDGKIIPGLRSIGQDRWCYRSADGKRATFTEPDQRRAVARFLELTTGKTPSVTIHIATAEPTLDSIQAGGQKLARAIGADTSGDDVIQFAQTIDESRMFAWMRDMLLTQPKRCAQETGIEQLSYLGDLATPTVSPTLEEVPQPYLEKAKITEDWRVKTKLVWKEFRESVGVTKIRDLTQEHLVSYYDEIMEMVAETRSPTYAKHRFGQIKVALNFARKRGLWAEDVTRALALCAVLIAPKSVNIDPQPISRSDYHKLLAAAVDPRMRAILLTSLNCVMYGQEVADIMWKDLNLDAGTLVMDRGKTSVARVAILWEETITALRALPKTNGMVFTSLHSGLPLNANIIGKLFRPLKESIGIPEEVKLRDIRDGGYTAAVSTPGVQYETARILGGHRCGMSDHYIKRTPGLVKPACDAIYMAYFG